MRDETKPEAAAPAPGAAAPSETLTAPLGAGRDEPAPSQAARGPRDGHFSGRLGAKLGDRLIAASRGLGARLLALTIGVVMVVEVLIFLPSAANFHRMWLMERVERAQTASLAIEASPTYMISEELARELLANAEVHAVALKRDGLRELILQGDMTPKPPVEIDLRRHGFWRSLLATCETLFGPDGRYLRLLDMPRLEGGEFIEVIVPEAPLKAALKAYSLRILLLSILVSAVTGAAVYAVLALAFVRPIRRLAAAMVRFRADPEDANRIVVAGTRRDEIGLAQRELAEMQAQIRAALTQRARLAALGEAVAKINHDLRNILTAAQLISDRLAVNPDPMVRAQAERLVRATSRGVRLAEDVLAYGRAQEPAAQIAAVPLRAALEDAFADAVAAASAPTGLDIQIDDALRVQADPEHVHRLFLNLMRNAIQAMAARPDDAPPGMLTLTAILVADRVEIAVADQGPGVPETVRKRLFTPFSASGRPGGSGLGLSIARELARLNGGDVRLEASGGQGAVFVVALPFAQPS